MTTIAYSAVNIQTSEPSVPSIPDWFGEITLLAHHLQHQRVLAAIEEQVRFARRRFGRYEVIDFVAVLFGYAVSGERTLEAFYERLEPWASAFMALFGRDRLPARSTLSRFLAALDQTAVESLRTLFLKDLLARPRVERRAARRVVGPTGKPLSRLRCGWHARGGPPTRPAQNGGSACSAATFASLVCPRLHRAQTRGNRAHAHHRFTGPYPSVACHVWKLGQRRVSCRTASSSHGHSKLPPGASASRRACAPAAGRAVWHRSRPRRSGRAAFCDALQRLSDFEAS